MHNPLGAPFGLFKFGWYTAFSPYAPWNLQKILLQSTCLTQMQVGEEVETSKALHRKSPLFGHPPLN